ncbi:hypothetical protein CHU98_g7986 [Xylaria longipes]|nr:hypothetical protein CHU98_g7986 [Xylaria longipes]
MREAYCSADNCYRALFPYPSPWIVTEAPVITSISEDKPSPESNPTPTVTQHQVSSTATGGGAAPTQTLNDDAGGLDAKPSAESPDIESREIRGRVPAAIITFTDSIIAATFNTTRAIIDSTIIITISFLARSNVNNTIDGTIYDTTDNNNNNLTTWVGKSRRAGK